MTPKVDYLDNTPNAAKLLESMRYLGYDDKSAICDILDNCIDANAKHVWINITKDSKDDDYIIDIADDGHGMTFEILNQAVRLGSNTSRSHRSDLGRFGMGLTTATLSLGRRLTVISKTLKGEHFIVINDIDSMISNNTFAREKFGPADSNEIDLFEKATKHSKQGTLVRISKADGFKRMYDKTMIKHLGQIYRYFIRNGLVIQVNGEVVPVNDPLWLDHKETEEFSNEVHDLKIKDLNIEEPIRIRLVILPNQGGQNENRRAGYNLEKSGFYILRNNREIASSQTLGLISRHPDFIRFRGEIFITGAVDEVMGIEFTKRDIKPTQAVRDQLEQFIKGDLRSIRKHLRKDADVKESSNVDYTKAEKYISSMAKFLITPNEKVEDEEEWQGNNKDQYEGRKGKKTDQQNNQNFDNNEEFQYNDNNRENLNEDNSQKNEDNLEGVCKFGIKDFSEDGPIYSAEQRGKMIYIDLNVSHPFYKRFILDNQDPENPEKLLAVHYLIYSMAAAELRELDEEKYKFIKSFKSVLSSNLRTLLSNI